MKNNKNKNEQQKNKNYTCYEKITRLVFHEI